MSDERCRCDFTDGPKDCACPCCGAGSYEPCRHGDELLALRAALAREKETRERAEAALRGLVERIDYVHAAPAYQGVWAFAQMHVGPYRGPQYVEALIVARAALAGSSGGATPAPSGTEHRDDGQGFRIPGSES